VAALHIFDNQSSGDRMPCDAPVRLHHRLHALDHGALPDGILSAQIALASSTPSASAACDREGAESVFDRIFETRLTTSPNASVLRQARAMRLLELRRIPRQVDIHDRACGLQVESDAALSVEGTAGRPGPA